MRPVSAACTLALLQLGCGTSKTNSVHDAPGAIDVATAPPDTAHSDASTACPPGTPTCPSPPADATLCGSGEIGGAPAISACTSVQPELDLGEGVPKACSTFTPVHGTYKVYCSASVVYVWASFDDVSSTDVDPCPHTLDLPDGGVVTGDDPTLLWNAMGNPLAFERITVGGVTSGGSLAQPRGLTTGLVTAGTWHGTVAFDGTLAPAGASHAVIPGTLYLAPTPIDCDRVPTAGNTLVLAAPVMWTVP